MAEKEFDLAKTVQEISSDLHALKGWIIDQEKRINETDEILMRMMQDNMLTGRKPYSCPICIGNGRVISSEDYCATCESKRIVWG